MAKRPPGDARLRNAFAWSILAMFVISYVISLFVAKYTPPAGLQPLMLIVVGYLFGAPVAKSIVMRKDDEEKK